MAYFKNQIYHSCSTNDVCVGCLFTYGRRRHCHCSHHQKCYIKSRENEIHEKKKIDSKLYCMAFPTLTLTWCLQFSIIKRCTAVVCLWYVFGRVKFIDFFFFRALPLCSHNLPARYPSLSLPFSGAPVHLVIRFLDAFFFSIFGKIVQHTSVCTILNSVFGIRCSVCVPVYYGSVVKTLI